MLERLKQKWKKTEKFETLTVFTISLKASTKNLLSLWRAQKFSFHSNYKFRSWPAHSTVRKTEKLSREETEKAEAFNYNLSCLRNVFNPLNDICDEVFSSYRITKPIYESFNLTYDAKVPSANDFKCRIVV